MRDSQEVTAASACRTTGRPDPAMCISCTAHEHIPGADSTKQLQNVSGQSVRDLPMARDGLAHLGGGVLVPVVLGTVPDEHTSLRLEQPEEIGALHAMLSSPTLCTQGI